MQVTARTEFANGSRLYLLDNILPLELAQNLLTVFQDSAAWQPLENFQHTPGRLGYTGSSPVIRTLHEYLAQPGFAQSVGQILGYPVRFLGYTMWQDQPGYYMSAHKDLDQYGHAVHIYIVAPETERSAPAMGTMFFTDTNRPVFEIAYNNNSGYLIDKTYTLTHGLSRPTQGPSRHSIYVRLKPWPG